MQATMEFVAAETEPREVSFKTDTGGLAARRMISRLAATNAPSGD